MTREMAIMLLKFGKLKTHYNHPKNFRSYLKTFLCQYFVKF